MWHSKSVKERDVTVRVRQRAQCMMHTKETEPQSGFASVLLKGRFLEYRFHETKTEVETKQENNFLRK